MIRLTQKDSVKEMLKFIHTADIHLDSPLKGIEAHEEAPVEEIRRATRRAFDGLIEMAIEEAVNFILIAGDLYDGDWKNFHTGLFFAARMGRLNKAGIRVFIISGNHDAASQMTKAMPLPDNVTLFSHHKPQSVVLDDLGVVIHGQSYSRRAVTDNLVSHYPQRASGYFNIGLLHTSLTGRAGHADYAPCSRDDLMTKGYDYWALGHVHTREVVSEDPWIVFPGNIQGRHVRETGPKGATLVTVDEGGVVGIEAHPLDVLRWTVCTVDLSSCEQTDDVHDEVRLAIEQALESADDNALALRLVLEGKCPIHAQLLDRTAHWTEEFRGICMGLGRVWMEKVLFQTRRKVDFEDVLGEDSPIMGLLQSIQQMKTDGDTLLDRIPELSVLKRKLPAEIHSNDSPFLDLAADRHETIHSEVRELLIAKLLEYGGS